MKTLTGINFRIFEHIQNNSELYKVIFVYNGIPNFYNELLEMIIRCIRGDIDLCNNNITGNFNDKDLIISYVSSSTMGVIKWWVQNDMPYTPNYMAKYIMKVTEEGAYKIFIQS